MLTVMGIKANNIKVDFSSATAEVTKHTASNPRRITKIEVVMSLSSKISGKNKKILEHTANTCPVHYSLHLDIEKAIMFNRVL
ncbi:putative stress-induced protein OsmC [hydrothermal vent metagenome]|uniref:Putative stress-induced protein OsmC n=1 Tax=hydrothermal vent metagenome TaxID=652676 RepID=A0A3B0TGB2_9ZZZZ